MKSSDLDELSSASHLPPPQTHKGIVVALYDFDPFMMSPNSDGLDEELPFVTDEPLVVRAISPLKLLMLLLLC